MTSVLILLSGFNPGTYIIEDDGNPFNGIAQLRGPDGSVIFFNIPTEFLTVQASAGRSVVFDVGESFGTAAINVGSLTDSTQNPDSILVQALSTTAAVTLASNGSITEGPGADSAADIIAGSIMLSASTGIGTGANALETRTATIEAETDTGGINLANFGNVVIGGLTDDIKGLAVATSGNLTFTNFGGIDLNDQTGFESIRGGNTSGNVTLVAKGFDSDIRPLVDIDAVAAPSGNITLTAGRDIRLGTQGLNFDNDVRASGDLNITAGRDVTVDGFADLSSDGFGAVTGGDVIIHAGRDINVLNSTGTDGSIGAEGSGGGNAILTTGPGGFVRLLASSASTLFSSTGDVVVNADRMVISSVAGISATSGEITLRPASVGWNVDLGSVTDGAFALEISDAELDRIFTPALTVGADNAGAINISAAITPANVANMLVRSGSDILVQSDMAVSTALSLRALDNIFQLGASTITTGSFAAFVDAVNDDPGVGNIATFNGAIVATNVINGGADGDTLSGNGANNTLMGFAGTDTLNGFGGNDTLDGGSGADQMIGGLGDDTYFVDNAGDTVIEAVGEGTDLVQAGVTYTLTANVENLRLTGALGINGTGNSLNNSILGNNADNGLTGAGGNDTINGGLGADTMVGGLGDDTFIVDNAGDKVLENVGEGTDSVQTTVTYTLSANVENLRLMGASGINGTGNALNNAILGNGANNALFGGDGNDQLRGGIGTDDLTGGTGADTFLFADGEFGGMTGSTADEILDFSQAQADKIDLTAVDANTGLGGDQAFSFIGSQNFHSIAGELRFLNSGGNTWVYGDTNGDGTADFVIRVDGTFTLVGADFGL